MELLLRLVCEHCEKAFIVADNDVDSETLTCPLCGAEVLVPDADEED